MPLLPLESRLVERIHRNGPLPFAEVVEAALYDDDDGFYAVAGQAGRHGDFLTSPEVGPLFGAVLARALDQWWDDLGRPDPYVVVEAAAGAGTLCAAVLAAKPSCAPALRYVMVERSKRLRAAAASKVALEPPGLALGPVAAGEPEDDDDERSPGRGTGPVATALAELPALHVRGVVLANELLDNLPFGLLEHDGERWCEVRVGEEGGALIELLVPAPPEVAAEATALAPHAADGARIPVQAAARAWLGDALGALERGRVVVVDYADVTPSMAARPWNQWVRTYRSHGRGGHPLESLGRQDVTCEVAVDQLAALRPPSADRSQATFLAAHGLGVLVDEARTAWLAAAAAPDLAALRSRSRVSEAGALTDPAGLGAFRVLEWEV